ncbi:GBS Bsp-like repeat-containing protein [Enterococcus sp. BWT-B8]|uniref:GBS Bsp-like repeat-containing protein n=1 Tax=Enterococcus sp. BWT-B8 TaxID=2885157 RepID=UPI001E28CA40|nr:GBS Bsp-like repeat-containing protein [Enterococcus sp. BWT-B8]MCB5953239.1 GBS Bsp-like repeat-containing protein [Enterococcus sp. BWT-B8]
MSKRVIISLIVCADLLAISTAPAIVVSAEDNTTSGMETQINEILLENQQVESSSKEGTISTEAVPESNTTETESSTSVEEKTSETTETEEPTVNPTFGVTDSGEGYTEPSPASRSDLTMASRRAAAISPLASIDVVNAGEENRPTLSFIDVSSHNGEISASQYLMMKNYGVTGVVVKLTEGTTYFNPYAQSQITNARTAGLKVSVYHYSHYTTEAGAKAEAAYFASKANSLLLPKDTVMVDDIEESAMRTAAVNTNTKAFKAQLNSSGYSKVAYYLSRSWLDVEGGVFSTSTFEKGNIWVAQYPYSPTASQNWNSDYSSWQWSSNFYFPGIAHPFDVNTDYTGLFTNGNGSHWNAAIPVTGTTTVADTAKTETTFKATAAVQAGGYTPHKVIFAVWSNMNGQDDIRWYEGSLDNNGTWSTNIDVANHKDSGQYSVHTYVQMLSVSSDKIFTASSGFSVSPVSASISTGKYDESKGTFDIIVEGDSPSGISRVSVPIWSKSDQSDIKWYDAVKQADGSYKATFDIKNHKYNIGKYNIHAYVYAVNGLTAVKAASPVTVTLAPLSGSVTIQDKQKTETNYLATATLSMGSYGTPKEIYFVTWSKNNGQDDIRWYTGFKQSNGTYTAAINIKNHKDTGDYNVHTYARLSDGTLKMVTSNVFTVSPNVLTVTAGSYNQSKGTFTVTVKGTSPSGLSKVRIPIWSQSNQSDIKWYDGVKQSDGSFKVTADVKNHKFNSGDYRIHIYADAANGTTGFAAAPVLKVTAPSLTGTLDIKDSNGKEMYYNIKLNVAMGIYGTPKEVLIPVWSQVNGQDDIQWYKATKNSNGSYSAKVDISKHKGSGAYNAHAYVKLADGTMKLATAKVFTVSEPTLTVTTSTYNAATKSFVVTLKGSSKSGISRIRVPVWSKVNQSDIKWYDAVKQSNGTYKVIVNIKDHGNNTGKYMVHAYMYSVNGLSTFGAGSQVNVTK